MEKITPKLSWKTIVFPIIGLVAFFLYIYLFNVDIIEIISNVQKANPAFFIIAFLCGIMEVLFFTI
jgi:uncharacterized membrane protein YbhN (UPF0104 family)